MAELTIYEKLLIARELFAGKKVQKSGKNTNMKFLYYELEDIVPAVNEIFAELRIVGIVNIHNDYAELSIKDIDKPTQEVSFLMPLDTTPPNGAVNTMQAIGASITYARRYLYMIALDIVEADTIDATQSLQTPPTKEERADIKKQLVDKADALQLQALKNMCMAISEKFGSKYKDDLNSVANETKRFTECSKARCEDLINGFQGVLNEVLPE